jgi:hypothetical protein
LLVACYKGLQKIYLLSGYFRQWSLEEEQYLCHYNMADQALRRGDWLNARKHLLFSLVLSKKIHNENKQKDIYFLLAIVS